jgi:hypothetical protein
MSDASLIQGEGMLRGTGGVEAGVVGAFTDYTKQFKGADAAALQQKALQQKQEREAKFAARTNAINSYMSQLKTNLDLTGYSAEQQRVMKNFLNGKRSEYAFAANELARIKDASDPEYQFYTDAMNAINNQIVNLAEQAKAYNERKLQFADLNEKGLWSAGNDPQSADQAAYIYGLGEEKAMMGVDQNGNITFDINGETMLFNDYKEPFLKDYKAAQTILDLSNTVYSAGELTPANKELIRMQLEVALQEPEALQSIISNDFTLDGINLGNIVYNPEDIAGTRNQVINSLLSAYESTAASGRGARSRGSGGSGRGSGSGSNLSDAARDKLVQLGLMAQYPYSGPDQPGQLRSFSLGGGYGGQTYVYDPTMGPMGHFIAANNGVPIMVGEGDNMRAQSAVSPEEFAAVRKIPLEEVKKALGIQ